MTESPDIPYTIRTANTVLVCSRWRETVDFYQQKLRFPVSVAKEWFVEFRLNDAACLSIADAKRISRRSCDGKGVIITLEVKDIEAVHAALARSGLQPPPIADHPWKARVFSLFDPEGNRVEFWSPNP